MNDEELERLLRTQQGPREQGYVPAALATQDGTARSGEKPLMRAIALLPAAAAGIAVVAVAAAMMLGPRDDIPGTGPSASPSADASSQPGLCPNGDIVLRPEPWSGAAGSRGTVVAVLLADGRPSCEIPRSVEARILDGDGQTLVDGVSGDTGWIVLEQGATYTLGISWSNWCGDVLGSTLEWDIRFGDNDWINMIWEQSVNRSKGDPNVLVPPCIGDGGTTLSVRGLQAAS